MAKRIPLYCFYAIAAAALYVHITQFVALYEPSLKFFNKLFMLNSPTVSAYKSFPALELKQTLLIVISAALYLAGAITYWCNVKKTSFRGIIGSYLWLMIVGSILGCVSFIGRKLIIGWDETTSTAVSTLTPMYIIVAIGALFIMLNLYFMLIKGNANAFAVWVILLTAAPLFGMLVLSVIRLILYLIVPIIVILVLVVYNKGKTAARRAVRLGVLAVHRVTKQWITSKDAKRARKAAIMTVPLTMEEQLPLS